MRAHQAKHPTRTMARVLGVSASGYYAWRARPVSKHAAVDAELTETIRAIHTRSRETYGRPRVQVDLVAMNIHVGGKRIARLMRRAGLAGVSRRKGTTTTRRNPDARPAPDIVVGGKSGLFLFRRVVANNANTGISSSSVLGDAVPFLMVRNGTVTNNGVAFEAQSANLDVAHSTVTGNGTAFAVNNGAIGSYGDNNVDGNGNFGPTPNPVPFH